MPYGLCYPRRSTPEAKSTNPLALRMAVLRSAPDT